MGRRKWRQHQDGKRRIKFSGDLKNIELTDVSIQEYQTQQEAETSNKNLSRSFERESPNINELKLSDTSLIYTQLKKGNIENSSLSEEESIQHNNTSTSHRKDHHSNSKCPNELQFFPRHKLLSSSPPDWKPNEKCNFCCDGKLLNVNEQGELVVESSPALSEGDVAHKAEGLSDSDSDSIDSLVQDDKVGAKQPFSSVQRVPNMTSFDSMAAQWSAIQSLPGLQSGLGQLYPSILYNLTQHLSSATPTTSETSAAAISPLLKDSPSPSDLSGEQPLDLSSKPPLNALIGGDARHIQRAKQRLTQCTGRRTYTEEELNNALQDIISGKLGTRRAAVQYNIPRSTLRNKVYKISSGAKRETPTPNSHLESLEHLVDFDYEKHDLSDDDEENNIRKVQNNFFVPKMGNDLAKRFAEASIQSSNETNIFSRQLQHSDTQLQSKTTTSIEPQPKHKISTIKPLSQPAHPVEQNAWQNILLQNLLFSGRLPLRSNFEEALQLFNSLLLKQDQSFLSSQLLTQLQQQMVDPQHQSLHQQQKLPSSSAIVVETLTSLRNPQPKHEISETTSLEELCEVFGDDPSVILKIPSYKPVVGSSSLGTSSSAALASTAKCNIENGENLSSSSSNIPSSSTLLQSSSSLQQHHPQQHQSLITPTANRIPALASSLLHHVSGESQSPPTLSLRDVIANSISRTFSQHATKETTSQNSAHSTKDPNDQYKRPSISVIKNIGGTDTSRFATAPNLLAGHENLTSFHQTQHRHQHHSQNVQSSNLSTGKGTRPKRGKYRNYDRDSLVEAVKAVQRGEMSVHRAGSYYGVPHSTLEYKVKERHLMRPRKREPKPQSTLDERTALSNQNCNTTTTLKNIPNITAVSGFHKYHKNSSIPSPTINQKPASSVKDYPQFSKSSPNGIKNPPKLFDPNLAAHLQYPPHLLWHGGFEHLQMELDSRSQVTMTAVASAADSPTNISINAKAELLKSQIRQRLNDNQRPPDSAGNSPQQGASVNSMCVGNENPYDTVSNANGSFLDGIIRQSLDRKSSEAHKGVLLDQLAESSRLPPSTPNSNIENLSTDLKSKKRTRSPLQCHLSTDIKRERANSTSDHSNSDSERGHPRFLSFRSLNLQHKVSEQQPKLFGSKCNLNGSQPEPLSTSNLQALHTDDDVDPTSIANASILYQKLGHIQLETEDSL